MTPDARAPRDTVSLERLLASARHHGRSVRWLHDGRCHDRSFTGLADDVHATAGALASLGIGRGSRVGILAGNGYEWIVVDLALLALDALSVACPEHFGHDGAPELVERFGLDALCVLEREANLRGPVHHPAVLYLDGLDVRRADGRHERLPSRPPVPEPWRATGDEYSFVVSSGTSGRLHGMMVRRGGAEDTIAAFATAFPVRPDDTLFVALPLSNLQQRLMVYGALHYGCDLAVVPPARLLTGLARFQPTILIAPPLFYHMVRDRFAAEVAEQAAPLRAAVAGLRRAAGVSPPALRRLLRRRLYAPVHRALGSRMRVMITGMAPIQARALEFFAEAELPLFEAYGTTETGIIAMNTPTANRRGTVGRVLPDTRVTLTDQDEVLVTKRRLLTRGYVVLGEGDTSRAYRSEHTVATGDVGQLDPDGFLRLRGRKGDVIVTSAGHKIHPEDVEARVQVVDQVRWATVLGSGMPYLVAVVGVDPTLSPDERRRVAERVLAAGTGTRPDASIQRVLVRTEVPSIDNGLLTRNTKLVRDAIYHLVEADLRAMGAAA